MYSSRRTPDEVIGEAVAEAIRNSGSSEAVVAAAADMRPAELHDALTGARSFEFEQLVAVGGFLSFSVPELIKEVVIT
ncbi:hypothetical protein P5G50_18540 [Leifsonia sp. F6_8S_P_1B]|uniref:Uncharacterized protein n=1 Tax=Leifsonia williamsii TaxID=3035919 RepID=A0ABT8KG61_9MICO|nr:hypothetical protein [Leifsonia williamsii]MDN4616451.1 hypothetical protein [Leifsonia williamsii]